MEDYELAMAAARGDREAFDTLVKRHYRAIYAIAYKIALHEERALDITQDVLVRLSQKVGDYRGEGRFGAWLATMTARVAVDYLRRSKPRESSTDPVKLTVISDIRGPVEERTPRDTLQTVRDLERIEAAMQELSPQQRAILSLNLREELGPKEIGERLDIPARQVRNQLHRAIGRLRLLLSPGVDQQNEERSNRNEV